MSFEFSTVLKYIPLNFHIIIGLLKFKISEIFKVIYEKAKKNHKSKKVSCACVFLWLGLIFKNVHWSAGFWDSDSWDSLYS